VATAATLSVRPPLPWRIEWNWISTNGTVAGGTIGPDAGIFHKLVGRKELLQQQRQLDFAVRAADFHVGQDVSQIADIGGEGLHLPDTFVNPLKLLDHPVERFP
jgi:hypothetical protein